MKKREFAIVIFIVYMVLVTLFQFDFVEKSFAQLNPCPSGKFPQTDSNGEIIHDYLGRPICTAVP